MSTVTTAFKSETLSPPELIDTLMRMVPDDGRLIRINSFDPQTTVDIDSADWHFVLRLARQGLTA